MISLILGAWFSATVKRCQPGCSLSPTVPRHFPPKSSKLRSSTLPPSLLSKSSLRSSVREELEYAKAANLCYADLHLPLGLWFPAMIMNGFENEHKANQAMRRELEDTRASLQRAQERIEAVQNTKLGKLKKSWSQFRQRIRSAGSK
jgi:hypothetical protein